MVGQGQVSGEESGSFGCGTRQCHPTLDPRLGSLVPFSEALGSRWTSLPKNLKVSFPGHSTSWIVMWFATAVTVWEQIVGIVLLIAFRKRDALVAGGLLAGVPPTRRGGGKLIHRESISRPGERNKLVSASIDSGLHEVHRAAQLYSYPPSERGPASAQEYHAA